jgi:phosphodiesterase/alkaline phosphatase D-like protein
VPELEDEVGEEDVGGGDANWAVGFGGEQVRTAGGVKQEMSAAEARKRQKITEGVASGKIELGPTVDWQTPHGIERKTMVREEFKVEDNQGNKLAWRKQVRLFLPSFALHC